MPIDSLFSPEWPSGSFERIIKSGVILAVLFIIRLSAQKIITNKVDDPKSLYKYQKAVSRLFYAFLIILIGGIWYSGVQSIATFLGLLSAGLAIAFRDYLSNVAGRLYIFWKDPIKIGHRVQIGSILGDIIDLGITHISLLEVANTANAEQPTGRIIFLPNSRIFTDPVANYDTSFPYIWHEVGVVVTFESDWKKAKAVIQESIEKHSSTYREDQLRKFARESKNFFFPQWELRPRIFVSVVDHGVCLSARLICEPRNRRSVEERIWEDILTAFAREPHIDFAYPTTRFYDHHQEGKVAEKGP